MEKGAEPDIDDSKIGDAALALLFLIMHNDAGGCAHGRTAEEGLDNARHASRQAASVFLKKGHWIPAGTMLG